LGILDWGFWIQKKNALSMRLILLEKLEKAYLEIFGQALSECYSDKSN
jgi:hypothetical protein